MNLDHLLSYRPISFYQIATCTIKVNQLKESKIAWHRIDLRKDLDNRLREDIFVTNDMHVIWVK